MKVPALAAWLGELCLGRDYHGTPKRQAIEHVQIRAKDGKGHAVAANGKVMMVAEFDAEGEPDGEFLAHGSGFRGLIRALKERFGDSGDEDLDGKGGPYRLRTHLAQSHLTLTSEPAWVSLTGEDDRGRLMTFGHPPADDLPFPDWTVIHSTEVELVPARGLTFDAVILAVLCDVMACCGDDSWQMVRVRPTSAGLGPLVLTQRLAGLKLTGYIQHTADMGV